MEQTKTLKNHKQFFTLGITAIFLTMIALSLFYVTGTNASSSDSYSDYEVYQN